MNRILEEDSLPPELLRALRETPIGALPMDADLEHLIHVWKDAPSNTASAMTVDDWARAWAKEWQRANRAEAALEFAWFEFERIADHSSTAHEAQEIARAALDVLSSAWTT